MILFYTATLGCKINQYETRSIAEAWCGNGRGRATGPTSGTAPEVAVEAAKEVDDPAEADVILVNSCAVTANAVSDLRQTVRRFHRDNPEVRIIITGCAAQVMGDELAELPGVVRVVTQEHKAELLAGPDAVGAAAEHDNGPGPVFAPFSISEYDRARPVVKVQDGCSHRCTFCIVPLARGRSVSRTVAEIENEVARLLDAGFREIILSGVNLRHFGRDLDPVLDFWEMVAHLEATFADEWAGRVRFRISSLEPGQLDDHALDVLAESRLVCPQLHISLQSGDPQVLKRMGRGHYSPEQAVSFCEKLRAIWPEFGLGADLLVGFPGENEEQFENTMDVCRRLPLTYGHVFPYSQRPGTAAAEMTDQVDVPVRKDRAARLRTLVNQKKKAFLQYLGTLPELLVLVQDEGGKGICEFYAPCLIQAGGIPLRPRSLVRCRPMELRSGVLQCVPL
jgi:threonylcarbamoyladenosine tRNA methylthiotransferase MtaB